MTQPPQAGLALIGFVLSALLVAQTGEFPVVDRPGLGLAFNAATERAERFCGIVDMVRSCIHGDIGPAAGWADHLGVHPAVGGDHFRSLLEPAASSGHVVHGRKVEIVVRITHGVEQIGQCRKKVLCGSEKTDVFLSFGRIVHGIFLSREIPPTPLTEIRGGSELSLAGRRNSVACRDSGIVVHLGAVADDASARSGLNVAMDGSDGFCSMLSSEGGVIVKPRLESVLGLDGVDVFHARTIALTLALVKRSVKIPAIFLG